MSVGPMGMIGTAAGTQLAQTKGSDIDKSSQESASQKRVTDSAQKAEKAASMSEAEQQSEAGERDADGRRLWEDMSAPEQQKDELQKTAAELQAEAKAAQSLDPTGTRGGKLDLSG